ncbi:hypothetical protein N2056_09580, partial [Escherichia coli]|uniref:hypothetical protein n=1 Tax=Escherichia coli TaxID=562 RepID=UPI0022B11D7C
MGEKSGKKRCAEITVCCDIFFSFAWQYICLLYTSEAADDRISVDLGGSRIIKKKKKKKKQKSRDEKWEES